MIMLRKKAWTLCSLLIIVVLVLSGCGSKRISNEAVSTDVIAPAESVDSGRDEAGFGFSKSEAEYLNEESAKDKDSIESQSSFTEVNRKIIKSSRVELETLEFDKTINAIIQKTEAIGGYVESSNISGNRLRDKGSFQDRYASFTLRIPEEFLDRFLLDINDIGNVILSENAGTDITGEYFDSEARLESLKIQEERLLEILKKAETVQDIIELERELASVRYQIENLTGTLRKWDNLVNYATIQISVYEVEEIKEPEPESLGDRIVDGFTNSIKDLVKLAKNFVILIAVLAPYIVIVVIVILILRHVLKKIDKRNKEDGNKEK